MATSLGRFLDRVNVLGAAFDDMEKSVIKATKHGNKPPKEKHVRKLVLWTNDAQVSCGDMIGLIWRRLEQPDWIIVLKTLIVIHRLFREGNARFMSDLKYKSNVFHLTHFTDSTSPESHHQSIFIRKYSQYLEEKVSVKKELGIEFDKTPDACKNLPVDEMFHTIPKLQSLVNALLNCRVHRSDINNAITITSFNLLLKDSFKLYRALNDGIINLLERYFTMNVKDAERALSIYKLFMKETDGVINLYQIAKSFASSVPDLQHAPTTLVTALEEYLKELKASGGVPVRGNEQDDQQYQDSSSAGKASGSAASSKKQRAHEAATAIKQVADTAETDLFNFDIVQPVQDFPASHNNAPANGHSQVNAPMTSSSDGAAVAAASNGVAPSLVALAPATATATSAAFDPFGQHSTLTQTKAANQLTFEEKMNNITMVQSLAAQQAPLAPAARVDAFSIGTLPMTAPAGPNYNNPFAAPATGSMLSSSPFAMQQPSSPFGQAISPSPFNGALAPSPFQSAQQPLTPSPFAQPLAPVIYNTQPLGTPTPFGMQPLVPAAGSPFLATPSAFGAAPAASPFAPAATPFGYAAPNPAANGASPFF